MADNFTVKVIKGASSAKFVTAANAYLDTLTATTVDAIEVTSEGHNLVMVVVSHA